MNKKDFIEKYRNLLAPKIRVYFNDIEFLENEDIILEQDLVNADTLRSFYAVRYVKNGELDERRIEEKITDYSTTLIRLATAESEPSSWGLSIDDRSPPLVSDLWPIPVATSLSNKTLILDSNHTALSIIKSSGVDIPIIRISGTNMEEVIVDFVILNHQQDLL